MYMCMSVLVYMKYFKTKIGEKIPTWGGKICFTQTSVCPGGMLRNTAAILRVQEGPKLESNLLFFCHPFNKSSLSSYLPSTVRAVKNTTVSNTKAFDDEFEPLNEPPSGLAYSWVICSGGLGILRMHT